MNNWGISGIILGVGFLICLILVLRSKWLQTRKNINDYQEGRDKLTFREPEEEPEEEREGGSPIVGIIFGFVVLLVGFSLMGTISNEVMCSDISMNVTDASCLLMSGASETIFSLVPLVGIILAIGIILAMFSGVLGEAGI